MQSVANIVQLRQLLAERFPNARVGFGRPSLNRSNESRWATGLSQIDSLLDGGLPKGGITELVSPKTSCGSALVISALIRHVARNQQWAGLIDAQDSFDPAAFDSSELRRLLWVRCGKAEQALKAADFLVRDGNLQLVLLDLRMSPPVALRKIPATTWYRLQRCLQDNATALLAITPFTIVGAAQARLRLQSSFTLEALSHTPDELHAQLKFQLLRTHGIESHAAEETELIAQAG